MSSPGVRDQAIEEIAAFIVCGASLFLGNTPLGNLPFTPLVSRIGTDPGQDFRVTEAFLNLSFQSFGIDPRELEKSLIGGAGVVIGTISLRQGGAAFVQATWQNDEATKTDAWAARWMLCEVR